MPGARLAEPDDDRTGLLLPRMSRFCGKAATPGVKAGRQATFNLLKSIGVLVLVAGGTFALCQLLLFVCSILR
jgi:hypothetical protein